MCVSCTFLYSKNYIGIYILYEGKSTHSLFVSCFSCSTALFSHEFVKIYRSECLDYYSLSLFSLTFSFVIKFYFESADSFSQKKKSLKNVQVNSLAIQYCMLNRKRRIYRRIINFRTPLSTSNFHYDFKKTSWSPWKGGKIET